MPHECASIIQMAYSISQRIDCEFLMTVPYTGVDLRLPENRWRVQQMVDALESIGTTVVGQLFNLNDAPLDVHLLFLVLEELVHPHVFPELKNIIQVIRGGLLLDREFFKSIKYPRSREFAARRNNVYPTMQRVLNDMGIRYVNQLIHRNNTLLLVFENVCAAMWNESKDTLILFFGAMLDTARELQ